MTSTLLSPSAGQEREYPPLPMPTCTFADHSYPAFSAAQMRAYVDADRKERQLAACNFCLSQAAEARAALTSACKQEGGEPADALAHELYAMAQGPQPIEDAVRAIAARLALSAPQPPLAGAGEALTESYVQRVPDKCDRIVWRNNYYHLPLKPKPAPLNGGCGDGESETV